jgi:tetratricopeptide (TPR) repeat protein
MGNNEMVGPFGAATVFGAKAPPLAMIRLNLAIQKTRLGQLLVNVSRKFKSANANATSWGGMEMFVGNQLQPDDPRKEVVYQNFAQNLHDIVKVGLDSGAKILLNTVAVNLKDCAPFASLENTNLSATNRALYDQFFADGVQAENQGRFADAVQNFDSAAKLDPKVAELQFRWGESLLQLTNYAEAHEHLQLACDDDALPFRTDSRINGIIRDEQKRVSDNNLIFFDAADALSTEAPEKISGQETFFEHVHFNFDGNYRLGRAWAQQVEKMLPAAISQNAAANDWATQETCDQQLGLSDWNRSLVIQSVVDRLQQPPLSSQLDNAQRMKNLEDGVNQLHSRMNAADASKTKTDFLKALERSPDDYCLHENFGLFLESIGDLPEATAEYQKVHDLIPQDCVAYFQLGRLLEMQDQYAEAESSFREAVTLRPSLTEGWIRLGDVLALENKNDAALASYALALKQRPQDSQTIFHYGEVLAKLNRHVEAIDKYRAAIKLNPANWETHYELGGELDTAGQLDAACDEFGEAARLNPGNSRTHFNHGVLLAKLGRIDAAQHEFEETIRLEPTYQKARDYLAALQPMRNNENPRIGEH